jgi:hypothetical protein
MIMRRFFIASALVVGCANDPVYMECPDIPGDPMCLRSIEAGQDDGMGGQIAEAKTRLLLPINLEKPEDAAIRAMRTAELGVEVPYVKLGDIEVSVEWTITNLLDVEGTALVELNGATEFFEYDPDLIVLSTEDDAPPTPGLDGNIPLHLPANGTLSGLFREDQVREASIDLEQVTRANVNPFAATLRVNKNDDSIQPFLPFDPLDPEAGPMVDPNAVPIPREAFANIIRIDLVFSPNQHMRLDYNVRVRDVRGEMMNELLMSAPADELYPFAPQPYAVMAAP